MNTRKENPVMPDTIIPPMRLPGTIHARGHAIAICGPETGHASRDIAFCDDAQRAADIVRACAAAPQLHRALADLVALVNKHGVGDDAESEPVIDRARAALRAAT